MAIWQPMRDTRPGFLRFGYQPDLSCSCGAGSLEDHPELSRAMRDMILWSSNTATNYPIDLITGATLLAGAEFKAWREKREALNRFFITGIRADFAPDFARCDITQKLMDDLR